MHSIVIHLDQKQEDWQLVEPFFYKVQSEKELTFFGEEEASASNPLFLSLVERITENLDRERIKDWQLIIIVNLHNDSNKALRLTTKLSEIREKLLEPLRENGIYPLQTILHVADMINRNSEHAPTDFLLRKYWELDHYGYFRTKDAKPRIGNAFTHDELSALDDAWGEAIHLQDIVLDHPSQEFMANLKQKCERVKNNLSYLINRKNDHFVSVRDRYISDVWMTPDQLESVFKDFDQRLKQLVKLPLSSALTTFTPSKELSSSLKYYVGIQGGIGDIRMVRQEVGQRSHRDRIRGYLELTYFLLTICHHPNLIDRMDKGSASVIKLSIEEEKLDKLLNHYYVSLLHVKGQVEDQLLLQNQFQTHPFRDDEFTPYTAVSLEKSTQPQPFLKRQKITPKSFDQWQNQLNSAEHHLIERDRELRQNSREGIKKLNVLKRKNKFVEEEGWVDINDYRQDLLQQIGTLKKDVMHLTPSLSETIGLWRTHVSEAKKRMHFLLQQIPNSRQLWTCSLLIFFILLMPLMSNASMKAMLYLIPAVVVTFLGYFLTKRAAQKPVWKFQDDMYGYTEKIYHLQVEAQHRYNIYLNHLYRLFSLRKFFDKASIIGENRKEHNLLLRYHLIKIDEYLQAAGRLLHILQFSTDLSSRHQEMKVPAVKVEKSVIDNPVYSPFQHSGLAKENGYRIEVYLGSAREQYQSAYINEIDKIRIQEDKVYKIWN